MSTYTALVLSLPARNSTVRMRVWRALKNSGCAVLRDGVYVLPREAAGAAALPRIESDIQAAGGFAMTVDLALRGGEQAAAVQALFDRSADYAALARDIADTGARLARLGDRRAQTAVRRLKRALNELAAIDFFPGQAKRQAAEALVSLERRAAETFARGEPHPAAARVQPVDRRRYRGRVWATRRNPWVDRLASAWLIKRFIDRDARFVWLERTRDRPRSAIGFDFDGAQFTHVGERVTFEVLLASFGLEHDPALAAIGRLVHFLDVGGIPVAEARGLETMLRGVRERTRGDDALLAEAMRIFDHLRSAYATAPRS